MNVSYWSARNPIPTVMFFVLVCFLGFFGFSKMKVQGFPDIELPIVSVVASLPGAAPGQLENDVARKIEDSISTIQGLKHIYTTIQDGSVMIMVEFNLEKPLQEAVDDVRSAVSVVRSDLPQDLRDPVVNRVELSAQPVLAFSISSPRMDEEALSWFVDDTVSRRLQTIKGVGSVDRVGGVNREISVTLNTLKLQALGGTALEVSQQLKQLLVDNSGGRVNLGNGEQPIRTLGSIVSAEELGNIDLLFSNGTKVKLKDIATVADTISEQRSLALLNGKPVVGFEVSRSRGESEVEVGVAVRQMLKELKQEFPDLEVTEAFDFVTSVEEEFEASMQLLYEGALLAVIVVWLFLRNWRATFISAMALPLSIIPTFCMMYFLGFSINTVSMLALSLVVGILVDDAIVEIENIIRHQRIGKTPFEAAMEAANEIGLAVIATSFTLIAVFLPTAFIGGIVGQFFRQFGWTAAFAVFASLVVARMLTPMMAAYMLKPLSSKEKEIRDPKWLSIYLKWAGWCLKHRLLTVISAFLFFIASLMLIPLLPQGFMPKDNNSQTQVYLELPPGSTLEQTHQLVDKASQMLMKIDHIESIYTAIGGGSAGSDMIQASQGGEVNKATLTIQLSSRSERPQKSDIESIMRQALVEIPGARIKVGLGASGEKYELALTGGDSKALRDAALMVERDLRTIPGLGSITSTASLVRPELVIRPDFARAADFGVTSAAIGETIRVATLGDYDMFLPKMNLSQRQVPILIRLDEEARNDMAILERLLLPGSHGRVMLGDIATLSIEGGPSIISRYDRSHNINLQIELAEIAMGDLSSLVAALPSMQQLPPGVKMIEVGDAEAMQELFVGFGLAMLTGILCVYTVLVILFKDFFQPFTLLIALPLSFGGAFIGLLLSGMSFSMPSLLGILMLMGIATKNSILLVEYAIVARRDRSISRLDALIDACHKRARPVIMTTMAMGAGMMPLAFGWAGADVSFRAPMAVAVIGGLITSTMLSLLVIPVVFTYVDDLKNWLRRRLRIGEITPS